MGSFAERGGKFTRYYTVLFDNGATKILSAEEAKDQVPEMVDYLAGFLSLPSFLFDRPGVNLPPDRKHS
jgi:hypothetical protein